MSSSILFCSSSNPSSSVSAASAYAPSPSSSREKYTELFLIRKNYAVRAANKGGLNSVANPIPLAKCNRFIFLMRSSLLRKILTKLNDQEAP
jgi:hypothetical protein